MNINYAEIFKVCTWRQIFNKLGLSCFSENFTILLWNINNSNSAKKIKKKKILREKLLFFNKKYMNGPIFLDSCVKGPIFLTTWYMHIFFAQRFFEAAYPLGITWIDCNICVITSKKWVQKIKGQYMNRSTFWMIKYMNESIFSKARYMNGVGFEILACAPVPKLPLSYPH